MKISWIILLILIPMVSFSQKGLEERIEVLPVAIHSGCDTITHTTQWGSELGELSLRFRISSATQDGDSISIVGFIRDNSTEDPLPDSEIYTAIFRPDYCDILQLLAKTGQNGRFEIKFENFEDLSLYFRSPTYRGVELKIGELKK